MTLISLWKSQADGGYDWIAADRVLDPSTIRALDPLRVGAPGLAEWIGRMSNSDQANANRWDPSGRRESVLRFAPNEYDVVPPSYQHVTPSWVIDALASRQAQQTPQEFVLSRTVSMLTADQLNDAISVVKSFDRAQPSEPCLDIVFDEAASALMSNTAADPAAAFFDHAQYVAPFDPDSSITLMAASSLWYQDFVAWATETVSQWSGTAELLEALTLRAETESASAPRRTTRVLQRVRTQVWRIRFALRRHAPPRQPVNRILAAGPGMT